MRTEKEILNDIELREKWLESDEDCHDYLTTHAKPSRENIEEISELTENIDSLRVELGDLEDELSDWRAEHDEDELAS